MKIEDYPDLCLSHSVLSSCLPFWWKVGVGEGALPRQKAEDLTPGGILVTAEAECKRDAFKMSFCFLDFPQQSPGNNEELY